MLGQVDTHGFGGDLIVPDGLEGPPVGGIDKQDDDGYAQNGNEEGEGGGQVQNGLAVGPLDVEAGKGREVFQHIGPVGDWTQLIPLEDGPKDLGKAQGGDGQIVALAKPRVAMAR